jgi:hypothetical protein
LLPTVSSRFTHFVFVGAGDAAGEGLAAGLALVTGAVPDALGEDNGDDVVVGAFELLSVSVAQPIAKAIAKIERSSSVVRPTNFVVALLIGFASFEQD